MQAKWNDLVFALDAQGARQLKSLSRRVAVKTQTLDDIVSSASTVSKGLEPFAVDLVFSTAAATGADIRALWQEYERFLGESDYLYVNEVQFYDKKLQLLSVDTLNITLDNKGRPLTADFRLVLKENTPEQKQRRVNKAPGNPRKRPPASTEAERQAWAKDKMGTKAKPTAEDKANYAASLTKSTSRP